MNRNASIQVIFIGNNSLLPPRPNNCRIRVKIERLEKHLSTERLSACMYSRATLITTPSRNATFHYHNGYVLIRLPERFVVHTCCHCWTLSPTSPAHKVESCSSRCSGSKTPPRPALTGFPLLLSMNVQSVFHPCLHRPLCCPIQTSEVPFSKSITADGMAKVRWPRCASVAVIAATRPLPTRAARSTRAKLPANSASATCSRVACRKLATNPGDGAADRGQLREPCLGGKI